MVYREAVKQETTEGHIASEDDGQSLKGFTQSVDVGSKKLIIKPSLSSTATAAAVAAAETKPKLLLLGPVEVEKKKFDNDDNNNKSCEKIGSSDSVSCEKIGSSDSVSCVDDVKNVGVIAGVECCHETVLSTSQTVVVSDISEPVQQAASVSVVRKGRKTGNKSAAGGRKGGHL